MIKSSKLRNPLLVWIIVIRVIITFIPIVNYHCPEFFKLLTILGLYITLFVVDKRFFSHLFLLLPLFIIDFLTLVLALSGSSQEGGIFALLYSIIRPLSWALVGVYFLQKGDRKAAQIVLYTITFCYVITGITTCIGCSIFPNAARLLANGMPEDQAIYAVFMNYNIGGFSFVNSLVVLTPLIIYLFLERKINRIVSISLLTIVLLTILISEYTIALLFFVSCFVLFILPRGFSSSSLFFILLLIVLVLVIFRPLFADLFYWLSSNIGSEQISMRFRDIANQLAGTTTEESIDLEDRINRWVLSIDAFKSSILVGTGTNGGGHSFLLDNLAKFGLIGLGAELIVFYKLYASFIRFAKGQKVYGFFLFALLVQVGLALVNPILFFEPFSLVMPMFYLTYANCES